MFKEELIHKWIHLTPHPPSWIVKNVKWLYFQSCSWVLQFENYSTIYEGEIKKWDEIVTAHKFVNKTVLFIVVSYKNKSCVCASVCAENSTTAATAAASNRVNCYRLWVSFGRAIK